MFVAVVVRAWVRLALWEPALDCCLPPYHWPSITVGAPGFDKIQLLALFFK